MDRTLVVMAVLATLVFATDLRSQETKKHAAVVPTAKSDDKNWADRHAAILQLARRGDIDVVFLGDSLTERWANNAAWRRSFAPLKAANFGIGGDKIEHLLWRVTEGKELDAVSPKVAVLMIGANNFNQPAGQIADNIGEVVSALRKTKPEMKVLVLGLLPRGPRSTATDDLTEVAPQDLPKTDEINRRLAQVADGKNVLFIDIGPKFVNEKGNLLRKYMPDFLHLSPDGYEIWAEAIEQKVKEMLTKM